MTFEVFDKLIRKFFQINCVELMLAKNKEYARGKDKLHNFKRTGERRRKSPEEALAGMQEKHRTSIDDMVQDLEERFKTEGPNFKITKKELAIWEEKLRDDINYDLLLWALLNERVSDD